MYNTAFLSWVVSHLPAVIGCGGFLFTCYKFLRFIFGVGRIATVIEQRVLQAEKTIYHMATNHLVHIQSATEESNKHLAEISTTLQLVLARRGDDAQPPLR